MPEGTVHSIHIADGRGEPTRPVPEIRAVPGQGLEGDRHFGRAEAEPGLGREVTLIELEAIEALEREYGVKLAPGDARRNIVTRGVPLNDLLGREFRVGEVRLKGVRLNEPCAHLASLTHEKVLKGLVHRGGLRAEILNEGVIRAGDRVEAV
ncbi:MAG TPA: MOSC domain-containing protein [Dehalococcoidia bacterium]|nr:MOSC domain-containing protein [Dehalococcoidia bacterium]